MANEIFWYRSNSAGTFIKLIGLANLSKRKIIGLVMLFLVSLLLVDYLTFPKFVTAAVAPPAKSKNGIWLRYKWYFGEHSEADWRQLLQRFSRENFAYAFFHVRHVDDTGRLHFHYAEKARALTSRMRNNCPQTKIIAWIYIGNDPNHGGVNLADANVRKNICAEANWLISECGFDGVQFDYEYCANGDSGLLRLLEAARKELPADKLLSVCSPMWYPGVLWGWGDQYFRDVANRCDQICVMGYDSFFYFPRAYFWLVSENVVHVSRATASAQKHCSFLMGVPTYELGTPGHSNHSETIEMSLIGVLNGLQSSEVCKESFEGVSLFAEYATSAQEWEVYEKLWSSPE